jgi:hypothetical protein
VEAEEGESRHMAEQMCSQESTLVALGDRRDGWRKHGDSLPVPLRVWDETQTTSIRSP